MRSIIAINIAMSLSIEIIIEMSSIIAISIAMS